MTDLLRKGENSTVRESVDLNCASSLGLQPAGLCCRYWTCQPPHHVSTFLKINSFSPSLKSPCFLFFVLFCLFFWRTLIQPKNKGSSGELYHTFKELTPIFSHALPKTEEEKTLPNSFYDA